MCCLKEGQSNVGRRINQDSACVGVFASSLAKSMLHALGVVVLLRGARLLN